MKTPHKHAELIKAWADGAEIEFFSPTIERWIFIIYPDWGMGTKYRIKPESKPEPKPDIVRWCWSSVHMGWDSPTPSCAVTREPDLKITFDGETGKLKSAEVL